MGAKQKAIIRERNAKTAAHGKKAMERRIKAKGIEMQGQARKAMLVKEQAVKLKRRQGLRLKEQRAKAKAREHRSKELSLKGRWRKMRAHESKSKRVVRELS